MVMGPTGHDSTNIQKPFDIQGGGVGYLQYVI